LDTGVISRNLILRSKTITILLKLFKSFSDFKALDFGGGEGIFVRLMRDQGFNFYRQDQFARNLYALYFDVNDLPGHTRFNILTSFANSFRSDLLKLSFSPFPNIVSKNSGNSL